MKVSIEGKNYFVKWFYSENRVPINGGKSSNVQQATRCDIYDYDALKNKQQEEQLIPLAHSHAICYFKDAYCKEEGRKITLDRAVKLLFPNFSEISGHAIVMGNPKTVEVNGRNRTARQAFWEAYRTMPAENPRWEITNKQKKRDNATSKST